VGGWKLKLFCGVGVSSHQKKSRRRRNSGRIARSPAKNRIGATLRPRVRLFWARKRRMPTTAGGKFAMVLQAFFLAFRLLRWRPRYQRKQRGDEGDDDEPIRESKKGSFSRPHSSWLVLAKCVSSSSFFKRRLPWAFSYADCPLRVREESPNECEWRSGGLLSAAEITPFSDASQSLPRRIRSSLRKEEKVFFSLRILPFISDAGA